MIPFFFTHHAYVDWLFEEWRVNNLNSTYPEDCKVSGSGKFETMPLLFPWRTNNEMYSNIATLGYVYQKADTIVEKSRELMQRLSEPMQQIIILGMFVVVLALVLFLFIKSKW